MKIIIIDDDLDICKVLSEYLEEVLNYDVIFTDQPTNGLDLIKNNHFDIVIVDIFMTGISGLDILEEIKQLTNGQFTDVIMITGNRDIKNAIQALRFGAYDYLLKPINLDEFGLVIKKSHEHQVLLRENKSYKTDFNNKVTEATRETGIKLQHFKNAFAKEFGIENIGFFSKQMKEIVKFTEKLHNDRAISVLIEGETGTGKEVLAKIIHYGKEGSTKPFVSINCSAISPSLFESELFGYEGGSYTGSRKKGMPGKLELANNGTIFLDEIGDLPLNLQPKLLRFLQDQVIYRVGGIRKIHLNIRVICATNQNLKEMVNKNRFRKDLFYRLNVSRIYIPPLRERIEEIIPLANIFLSELSKLNKGTFRYISPDAKRMFRDYPWKGNIRELKNVIEFISLKWDDAKIEDKHLDFLFKDFAEDVTATSKKVVSSDVFKLPEDNFDFKKFQLDIIKKALELNRWNKTKTAEYLGISRKVLYTFLKKIEEE